MADAGLAGSRARASELPELAAVYWRPRASARSLARTGRLWTLSTVSHTVPFVITAVLLGRVKPITIPVGLILLAHAWIIPELYAARGANVVSPRTGGAPEAEQRAMLLLGDLIGHAARALYARTGLVSERGRLGVWLVGEAGALLVRAGRDGACTATASRRPTPSCPRPIASRTCCWRCEPTSPGSPPWPTWPSPARAGGCGAGCQAPAREALDHAVGRRGQPRGRPGALRMFVPGANAGFSRGRPSCSP